MLRTGDLYRCSIDQRVYQVLRIGKSIVFMKSENIIRPVALTSEKEGSIPGYQRLFRKKAKAGG